MKIWETRVDTEGRDRSVRHEFVIGPQFNSPLFTGKARLYYCVRCKWNFLVSRDGVAVLDERGNPLTGSESSDRFNTFEDGPCPVFKALVADALIETAKVVRSAQRRNENEHRNL